MQVLYKEVGEKPRIIEIDNEFKSFQALVCGPVEAVPLPVLCGEVQCYLLCNEEGTMVPLPFNCELFGQVYVGNIVICGEFDEDFCTFPYASDIKLCEKTIFRELWEVDNA